MKKLGRAYIGTSGWKYKHWDKVFYPPTVKKADQLQYYHSIFNTVELNNSFYRQPEASNFDTWKNSVPPDFTFAVKGNRFFTHLKKLNVSSEDVMVFLDKTAHLEEKLGVVLFQLPPKWNINMERMANFLKLLPKNIRFTFEFRNHTWYTQEIYELLHQHNCAFCIYELAGHLSPLPITADFIYVRLHGPGDKYQGSYSEQDLNKWENFIREWTSEGKDVFLYFDNDQEAFAAFNAIRLNKMLSL